MPGYFRADLDNEKILEDLQFVDMIMSIQAHLADLLDEEENASSTYRYGYTKALLDFASALYREL